MGLVSLTIRFLWFVAIGWWLGPLMFIVGAILDARGNRRGLGYKLMDSAYNYTVMKF